MYPVSVARLPYRRIPGLTSEQEKAIQRNIEAATQVRERKEFSSIGYITVSDSGPFKVRQGGRLFVDGVLSAALTGDTDVDILVNGVVKYTLTIPSGEADIELEDTGFRAKTGDVITVAVTAVGTGDAYLTVTAEMHDVVRPS